MERKKEIDFSIIIPTYNASKYIDETFGSILQSAKHAEGVTTEIIVVDGKSTDNTIEKVKKFANIAKPITVKYVSRKDKGSAEALNEGFNMAHGKYLTFIDSDDLFTPAAIKVFMEMFKSYDIVVGEREGFKVENGKNVQTYTKASSKRPLLREIAKEKSDNYFLHAHICSTPFAFSKERFMESEKINETMKTAYDYDLSLKLIYPGRVYPPGYTEEVLLQYRERPDSLSSTNRELQTKEGEIALNDAFKRIGLEGIEAKYKGKDHPGYLYWEHKKLQT